MNTLAEKLDNRAAHWTAFGLFILTILTRLPFQSQYLYHFDSVNMAFGIIEFNVLDGAPQFPGYIVYIAVAQALNLVFNDPQRTMMFISIVSSGLAAAAIFYLGRRMFSLTTGIVAAILLMSSPLFWFYGEIALPHTLDMFTVIAAVYLLYQIMIGNTRWLWWTVVYLALVGGFRQQTLLFLAPLMLFTCYRLGLLRIVLAGILGAAATLTWFLPLMAYSNGIDTYMAGSSAYSAAFFNTTSLLAGAGLFGLQRNLIKLIPYTLYGWALAALPALYWLSYLRYPRVILTSRTFWFIALWMSPALAFYIIIHMGQQGLVFVFLPALFLISAEALSRIFRAQPDRLRLATGIIALVGAGIFIFAPTNPLGESGPKLLTYGTLREHDTLLDNQIRTVRDHFGVENTLLLASEWRHIQYYLPEYPLARFVVGSKFEANEGQATDTVDYINQPAAAEEFGLDAGEAGWQIVVMDDFLQPFSAAPLEQASLSNGFELGYMQLQSGEAYFTDGLTFGAAPLP